MTVSFVRFTCPEGDVVEGYPVLVRPSVYGGAEVPVSQDQGFFEEFSGRVELERKVLFLPFVTSRHYCGDCNQEDSASCQYLLYGIAHDGRVFRKKQSLDIVSGDIK